jgi:hypothetical protein
MAERNHWTPREKATYLIAVLNEPAGHILPSASAVVDSVLSGGSYQNHFVNVLWIKLSLQSSTSLVFLKYVY